MATYTIKNGDTLSDIAKRYGTTYQEIAKANGISDPNKIYEGQTLEINDAASSENASTNVPTTQTPSAGGLTTVPQPNTAHGFSYADYTKSDAVLQAEALLNQHNANKPGAYQSQWQDEIDDYLNKYQNRDPFSYDFNSDALYQQYKDQYIQQGRMAMMDAMGQASAMTGGYGNSYAQTVGQQVYNQNLNQLNNIMPELYDMAYGRYTQEGQDLLNMYGMYLDRENQDYGRYQDDLNAWEAERAHLEGNYNTERDLDYSEYIADKDRAWDQYLMDLEKEQAAAELMAGIGDYERLKDIYGLTDDELAAIKDANKPKGGRGGGPTGPTGPTYIKLVQGSDDYNNLVKAIRGAESIEDLDGITSEYLYFGYNPDDIWNLWAFQQKHSEFAPTGGDGPDTTVQVNDLAALKARQDRNHWTAGNMTRK